MVKQIADIEIGTQHDDKRYTLPAVFIRAANDKREIRSMTPDQALELVSAIIDAVREATEENDAEGT